MVKLKSTYVIALFLILFSDVNYSQNSFFQKSPYKYAYGDSIKWKDINYNDSAWQILYDNNIEYNDNFCWIRTTIFLSPNENNYKDLVLLIDLSADYEIYWNGKKLGQNFEGIFPNVTGKGIYSESYQFSDSLEFIGKNILAIRTKLDENNSLNFQYMNIADPIDIKISEYRVFGHLFFLMVVYLGLLILVIKYFGGKVSFFLTSYLSLLALLMFISLLIEFLFFAGFMSFASTYFGENLITIIVYLTLFSFSLFFAEFNKIKYEKTYLLLIGLILLTSFFLDLGENYYLSFGIIPPLIIIYFYHEKLSFIKIYSISFFAVLVFFIEFLHIGFISLIFLILLFYMSVVYLRNENYQKAEMALAKMRSVRLETEMLKKIIQPHYIMNSLNSVIEWIEESPKDSLSFIKELSDEFRSFSTFAHKKSVSLREEIELCKNHLKVMEFRHHNKYRLYLKIENLDRQIPPAILHTLIENGINHHPPDANEICFRIETNNSDVGLELKTIVNYCNNTNYCKSLPSDVEIKIKDKFNLVSKVNEGNGIRYIRSRLTESYGENWKFNYYGDESVWVTNINILGKTLA